jgi:hypothetical protein
VNGDRNTDEITNLKAAFESALKLAKMALDEWPEQTELSAKAIQGQFLYVQARSAEKLATDYLHLRSQPDSLGFKVLARHIFENHINAKYGALSPEHAAECLLFELNQEKKKLTDELVADDERFMALALRNNREIEELGNLVGPNLVPRNWKHRAKECGLGKDTHFRYMHLCGYAHAEYSSWRPFESTIPDPSVDRMVATSVLGTSRILHEWTNQCVLEGFSTEMRQVEALIEGLP